MKRLSRRALLRGAGGVAIGLPFLDIMLWGRSVRAQTAPPPKRFFMMFAGALSAGQGSAPNYFVPGPWHPNSTPLPEGNYTATPGLQALVTHGVKDDVAIISRLLTPSGNEGGVARWQGTDQDWHSGACYAQIMGCTVGPGDVAGGSTSYCHGAGPDYLLAALLEPNGTTQRILNLGAQPVPYTENNSSYATFTFKPSGSSFVAVGNTVDPATVWNRLFGGTPPAPVKTAADYQQSVLDVVKADVQRLRARLGRSDLIRLDQHFDEIRNLEITLQEQAQQPPAPSACVTPANPAGAYPAPRAMGTYSGEFERARLMCDLIHMAFVCDKSRIATLILSNTQSQMDANRVVAGYQTDLHETNHGGQGTTDGLGHAKMINWHIDHFAYLLAKLKNTSEGAERLIDRVGALFFLEGGAGRAWTGSSRGEYTSHTSEHVVVLVGGHAGGLKVGQHYIEAGTNPASVTLSVMRALGHQGPLNEVSAVVPRLLP